MPQLESELHNRKVIHSLNDQFIPLDLEPVWQNLVKLTDSGTCYPTLPVDLIEPLLSSAAVYQLSKLIHTAPESNSQTRKEFVDKMIQNLKQLQSKSETFFVQPIRNQDASQNNQKAVTALKAMKMVLNLLSIAAECEDAEFMPPGNKLARLVRTRFGRHEPPIADHTLYRETMIAIWSGLEQPEGECAGVIKHGLDQWNEQF